MAKSGRKPNIWVGPHPDGGWQQKHEGSNRASKRSDTKQDVVSSAIEQAKREGVEVIIQRRDGIIISKDSYGKDTNPPKDTEH